MFIGESSLGRVSGTRAPSVDGIGEPLSPLACRRPMMEALGMAFAVRNMRAVEAPVIRSADIVEVAAIDIAGFNLFINYTVDGREADRIVSMESEEEYTVDIRGSLVVDVVQFSLRKRGAAIGDSCDELTISRPVFSLQVGEPRRREH